MHRYLSRFLHAVRRDKLLLVLLLLYLVLIPITRGEVLHLRKLVDIGALALIYSIMLVSALLEESGAFSYLAVKTIRASGQSARRLLVLLSLVSLTSAAIVMNDTSMFMYVPVAVSAARFTGIDTAMMVSIIAIAANIGSSLTPIGNPQNIIIWRFYGLSFPEFVASMTPFVAIATLLLLIYIVLETRRPTASFPSPPSLRVNKRMLALALASLVAVVAFSEKDLPILALLVSVVAVLVARPRILLGIDYLLVVSFALMFADFRSLGNLVAGALNKITSPSPIAILLLSTGLSQVVSNVPATILLVDHVKEWKLLAYGVNLGGVGFVTGSLANIIAIRLSGIRVRDLHRHLLPYFLSLLAVITLLVALGLLV